MDQPHTGRQHFSLEDSSDEEQLAESDELSPLVPGQDLSAGRLEILDTNLPVSDTNYCNFQGTMGQFYPTIRLESNSITPFLNLPPPPPVQGAIRVCNYCDSFAPSTDIAELVCMIFPSGPTREPPPGYSIPEAIRDSGISQVIGPTTGMQQNSLLFPFDCLPPAHGVHLQCLTREILMQIQQPSSNQLPIDLIHCSICGARLLLSIRNQMDINRTTGTFPFYLFPTINNRGGITGRLGLAVGPSLSPSGNPHSIVPTQPECNFCNLDRFDSPRSQLLCSLFSELAASNGETYDEPRLAAFWVDRFSLDDLSLTPFSSLNEFVSPFTCDHEVHAGCFLWLIFHVSFDLTSRTLLSPLMPSAAFFALPPCMRILLPEYDDAFQWTQHAFQLTSSPQWTFWANSSSPTTLDHELSRWEIQETFPNSRIHSTG